MNIIELSKLIQSESDGEEYLRKVGILKTYTNCPKCNSTRIGRIRRNKIRCYSCKYEWNIRKGSVLEGMIIENSKFIACVKMFELGIPVTYCVWELNIANETAVWTYQTIRKCLAGIKVEKDSRLGNAIFDKNTNSKILIRSSNNKVEVVWNFVENKEKLSEWAVISTKRLTNEQNQITYTYSYKHNRNFIKDKVKTYDLTDRFWSFAKPKLKNLAISKFEDLYLYLKELEFRFNNRNQATFEFIIEELSQNSQVADCLMG